MDTTEMRRLAGLPFRESVDTVAEQVLALKKEFDKLNKRSSALLMTLDGVGSPEYAKIGDRLVQISQEIQRLVPSRKLSPEDQERLDMIWQDGHDSGTSRSTSRSDYSKIFEPAWMGSSGR